MDINAARSAGVIAAQVDAIAPKLAVLQAALAQNAVIKALTIEFLNPDGSETSCAVADMTLADSQSAVNLAISIYSNIVTAFNAQLAAL